MKVFSAPLHICFGITNQCNLNCKHCLASNTRSNPDLTTEELLDIIKQIIELKIFNVSIFGGEPLLRKDFFTIVEALNKPWIRLSLNTNGTLITKDLAGKLASSPIKNYTVSLDGSCSEVQDPIRGKGSFEKNIDGIRNLIELDCNVLISTTVTRYNYKDVENIVLLGKNIGTRQVRFNEVMYIGNAACYHKSLIMTPKEKFDLLEKIKELRSRFGGFVTGSLVQVLDIMEEIKQNKHNLAFPLIIPSCGAATTKCAIRPDGLVSPCENLWDIVAGDLRKSSLYQIWHNSSVMNKFREPLKIEDTEIPECKNCLYLRLCYKGHRCTPYYLPGDNFEHKELYCWNEDVLGTN
ncbi:MAG: radical SAM protein [Candidatus Omnitrophica bacterium]|nr:radical SAM protein [Candidatus Omnitrophota bacterium]